MSELFMMQGAGSETFEQAIERCRIRPGVRERSFYEETEGTDFDMVPSRESLERIGLM